LKKGCIVPLHSHYNEQLTYILEGALKFWIDGKEIVVRAGEVLTIPRNMPHKAEALEDTVDLDIFNPPRADWINKTDQYLLAAKLSASSPVSPLSLPQLPAINRAFLLLSYRLVTYESILMIRLVSDTK